MGTSVSIVRCPGYDENDVLKGLRQSIDLIGGIEHFVRKRDQVLLKPNLLYGKPPEKAVTTHPAIVKGMILEGRMAHNGKMTLTEQVNRAVAGRTQASITLTSQKSPGPIEQCRCMVAAAGMAAKPQSNIRKPMIGSSR